MSDEPDAVDVIIAGGGPAGLQAALVLGRARRHVLLCDSGEPRNAVTGVVHGFLSRDGIDPADLRRIASEELDRYPTVERRPHTAIATARGDDGRFVVGLADGSEVTASKLILATGVVDELPGISGLEDLWGRSVFHCAYCDGYERRDQPLAVIDSGPGATFYALQMTGWSRDVVLCTNGKDDLPAEERERLSARGIGLREAPIARLERTDGVRVVFAEGAPLERLAIFVHPPTRQRSELPAQLGCMPFEDDGSIEVNDFGQTDVPGVFAAGDMARRPTMPFPAAQAIHAASAGGIAAVVADMELAGRPEPDTSAH